MAAGIAQSPGRAPGLLLTARTCHLILHVFQPAVPAGAALFAVPGTSQARQAVVAATTPHTQTVCKSTTATVAYDGQPQFNPIEGTPLRYAVNASPPVIRIDEKTYYVVR